MDASTSDDAKIDELATQLAKIAVSAPNPMVGKISVQQALQKAVMSNPSIANQDSLNKLLVKIESEKKRLESGAIEKASDTFAHTRLGQADELLAAGRVKEAAQIYAETAGVFVRVSKVSDAVACLEKAMDCCEKHLSDGKKAADLQVDIAHLQTEGDYFRNGFGERLGKEEGCKESQIAILQKEPKEGIDYDAGVASYKLAAEKYTRAGEGSLAAQQTFMAALYVAHREGYAEALEMFEGLAKGSNALMGRRPAYFFCAGLMRLLSGESIGSISPDLTKEWYPEKGFDEDPVPPLPSIRVGNTIESYVQAFGTIHENAFEYHRRPVPCGDPRLERPNQDARRRHVIRRDANHHPEFFLLNELGKAMDKGDVSAIGKVKAAFPAYFPVNNMLGAGMLKSLVKYPAGRPDVIHMGLLSKEFFLLHALVARAQGACK